MSKDLSYYSIQIDRRYWFDTYEILKHIRTNKVKDIFVEG